MVTGDQPVRSDGNEKLIAGIAYGLYALGLFGVLIPSVIAVIINYIKVNDVSSLYQSHHRWMIRTFWWGLLWVIVGSILVWVFIGWLILAVTAIWWIYRIVRGVLALSENRSLPIAS